MLFKRVLAAKNSFHFAQVVLKYITLSNSPYGYIFFIKKIRSWSTTAAHLEHQINKDLENEVYKPKNHPGRSGLRVVELPEHIRNAIKTAAKGSRIC